MIKALRASFFFLFFCHTAYSVNVTIIESQSFNAGHMMDVNWQTVATGMGYTATISPQSTLLVNTWFASTDILIVSSGVIMLPQQAIDTIQSFVRGGGHVFLQTEYLSSYATNGGFQYIVNNLGGSFAWGGTTAGTLAPMQELGSLSNTPNATSPLTYFWYGDYGTWSGCNSHIEGFLLYQGLYYGFIFAMPVGNGRLISTSDQDWVNQYTTSGGLPLMQNILANLATPVYNIAGGAGVTVNLGPDTNVCSGSSVVLSDVMAGATYLWSNGSTASSLTVTTPGLYWLQVTQAGCVGRDSINITFNPAPVLTPSTMYISKCPGDTGLIVSPTPAGDTVIWQNGSHAPSFNVNAAGVYWYEWSNSCGVSLGIDSFVYTFNGINPSSLGPPDTTICNANSVTLMPSPGTAGASYVWHGPGTTAADTLSSYTATAAGLFIVNISKGGCSRSDTITVAFAARPVLPPSTMYISKCPGDTGLIVSPTPAGDTVIWQNGSHAPSFNVNAAGVYWYEWSNSCGVSLGIDSFVYTFTGPASPASIGRDTLLCNGSSITLSPAPLPAGAHFVWQGPGSAAADTLPNFSTSTAGLYILQVSNQCGAYADSVTITTLTSPPPFSIGVSQSLCAGYTLTLLANPLPAIGTALLWQDGVTTADSFVVNTAGTYHLSESNVCGVTNDTVVITASQLPTVSFNPIPLQCNLDSILLIPITSGTNTYVWSSGSTQPAIYATQSGSYQLTVTDHCGSTATATVQVRMMAMPVRPFNDLSIDSCLGTHMALNAGNDGRNYLWSNGSTLQTITAIDSGLYAVTISDSGLCPVRDTVYVSFHNCAVCRVAVPGAFSPNGDGRNDVFRCFFECATDLFAIRIYDRWGEAVYESTNQADSWDGTYKNAMQPLGVYVYYIQYRNTGSTETRSLTGNVTLLR